MFAFINYIYIFRMMGTSVLKHRLLRLGITKIEDMDIDYGGREEGMTTETKNIRENGTNQLMGGDDDGEGSYDDGGRGSVDEYGNWGRDGSVDEYNRIEEGINDGGGINLELINVIKRQYHNTGDVDGVDGY
jgi:hypothetical protein